ncbi:S8 family serine peptidase [Streptomyces sp. 4N509B]|uniref:S8 family serine peptidase n=1 Tax=Streptomyces sp. 4N509B TaxID=3457413 RepID=UPI003FD5EDC4
MSHSRTRRTALAAVAAAVAVGLTAGLTPPGAEEETRERARHPSAAEVTRQVTLITGDRVVVDGEGRVTGLVRAEGRESVPVQVLRDAREGATYAIPADALPLVASGTVDRRLFNVTELSREQYGATVPVIVTYEEGAPARRARAGLRAAGASPGDTLALDSIDGEALQVPPDEAAATWRALTRPGSAARTLAAAPGVERVVLDAVAEASLADSVPQVGAPRAWEAGHDGTGTTIAVLDTGISPDHEDVAGKVTATRNFTDDPELGDAFGHGTHVASIAAGTGAASDGLHTGVAPGASLLNGKVLDRDGFGRTSWIVAGMEWAVEQGADVVNMSLSLDASTEVDPLEEAVNTLSAASDTLFVVAAGNAGGIGPETVGTPGQAEAALTVGAVDKSDVLAPFSSTGPRVRDGAVKPDLTAPGVAIGAAAAPGSFVDRRAPRVAEGYAAMDGTSMATPHVAGAAALLAQRHPEWTGEDIRAALVSAAEPGDHTPFEQGTGRLDVAAALDQTVLPEPGGLTFGVAEWPHADDAPITRELTYRNLGAEDVTLRLSATGRGPDGAPAPEGTFTLGREEVTVPSGSAATVEVTADTTVPELDGPYTLEVTATGPGGRTVRAVGSVEREVESHDVTVEATGRDGRPAGSEDWVGTLTDTATGDWIHLPTGEGPATLRVPAGTYLAEAVVLVRDANEDTLALDWLLRPQVTVDGDTSLNFDARDAAPIDVTVAARDAERVDVGADFTFFTPGGAAAGLSWYAGPAPEGMGTAQLGGPVPADWDVHSAVGSVWSDGERRYHTAATRRDAFPTGLSQHLTARDFARLTVRQGASLPDRTGALLVHVPIAGLAATASYQPLPRTTRAFVQAEAGEWTANLVQDDTGSTHQASYHTPSRTYEAGRHYRETLNVGVFGPSLGSEGDGLFRDGDLLLGWVNPLADGAGNRGESAFAAARTTLYRDGEEFATADGLLDWAAFELPPEEATYELVTTVTGGGLAADVSTEVTASYTFTSARPAAGVLAEIPASAVRFAPRLALDSTAEAGRRTTVPVTVQGSGAEEGGRLTVSVSTDGGESWREARVVDGAVRVTNPAAGGSVSLRAEVTDAEGNVTTQTIIDAYRTA